MKLRLIGDIHGNFNEYLYLISDCDKSVQVGDYGIGFRENPIFGERAKNHRFIRGNHDSPEGCLYEPNWIPDGHFENGIFYVGGAYSIDKDWRTPGLDWWPEEQLTLQQMEEVAEAYEKAKPDIMITHEIPAFVTSHFGKKIFNVPENTRPFLEELYKIHQPRLHVCGHWHFPFDKIIDKTRFVVLDINQLMDIETEGSLEELPYFK